MTVGEVQGSSVRLTLAQPPEGERGVRLTVTLKLDGRPHNLEVTAIVPPKEEAADAEQEAETP